MKRKFFILLFLVFGLLVIQVCPALGNWQYVEGEAETTTTSTSWVTKVQLISNSGGYYLLLAGWEMGNSGDTSYALARVSWNASVVDDFSMETFDGTNRYRTFAVHSILNLAAGDSIKIQYGTNNSSFATRIKRARILLIPLSGIEYNTATGLGVINLTTSWLDAATVNITPATAGDYLIIGSLGLKPNSTTFSGETRIELDGASTWDPVTMEGKDISDKIGYLSARVVNLNAASHTIRLQARSDEDSATDITEPRISVIRLTKTFNDFSQTEQTDEDTATNGSDNWVNRVTHLHTPKNAGSYLVLCHSLLRSIPDTSVIPEQRWTENGVEQNKFFDVLNDSTDYLPNIGFRVFSWDATQKTLGIDFTKNTSGTEPVYIKDARIIALSEALYTGAPVLDSIGPKSVNEEDTLSFRIHATDPDGDSIILDTVNVPSNATFIDSGNGVGSFTFTPDFTQSGIYNVTFKAQDTLGGVDSEVVQVTVNNVNRAPVLSSIGSKTVAERDTLRFRVSASDPDGDSLVLNATNLPIHASFRDSGNGRGSFTFTPDTTQAGIYHVTFIASDRVLADSEMVAITVTEWRNRPPVLDSIGSKTVLEGDSLRFVVTASDSDGTIPVLSASNLPVNATFRDSGNGHGLFRFKPTFYQAGKCTVTFTAIDMSFPPPLSDFEKVVVTIVDVNQPPVIDSIGPKNVRAGSTLNVRVVGHDLTDPDGGPLYMTAISLPENSSFHDSGGGIAGFTFTPDYSQVGVDTVTFFCTDEGTPPLSGFRVVVITVTPGPDRPPVLDPIGGYKSVREGDTLRFRIHATDPDGNNPFLYTSLPRPRNAIFVDSGNGSGSFTFTPDYTQSGLYEITFYASDGDLYDYEEVLIQVIEAGNQRPILDSIGPKSVTEGDSLIFMVHAVDPDSTIPVLSASNLPSGSSFTDSLNGWGIYKFHPLYFQAGTYHVTFIASDAVGAADSEVVEITVIDAGNQTPVLDSIGPKTVQETQWLNFAVRASDADSTIPRLRASHMPPGATFQDNGNGTGGFGYHPNYYADSVYYVVFKAIDAVDTLLIDSEVVKITVIDVNQHPQIYIQPNLTTFQVNEGDSVKFLVIGTDPDSVVPSVHVKSLPNNATFVDSGNGTGVFVFRPDYTQGGFPPEIYKVYPYVVDGRYDQDTIWDDTTTGRSIWVYNVPVAPVIVPINDTSITEGQTLRIRVVATHPVGPPTLKAINLPTNATFKDSGGGIGGFVFTPSFTQAGVYGVTFIATKEKTDSEFVQITVIETGDQAPVLAPLIDSTAVAIGDTFKLHPRATDPDGPSLTLSASPLPTNSDFHDSGTGGGLFRFYPDSTQKDSVYHVIFVASDGSLADTEIVAMRVVTFIRGDANGDRLINGSDVVYLINYLFAGGPPPTPLSAGDANNDGFVNASDVVYLINYLYQGGPPPPGGKK